MGKTPASRAAPISGVANDYGLYGLLGSAAVE